MAETKGSLLSMQLMGAELAKIDWVSFEHSEARLDLGTASLARRAAKPGHILQYFFAL